MDRHTISDVLRLPEDRPIRCMVIGAHCDDIEIGAGGTILRLLQERPDTQLDWVVLTSDEQRASEARASARTLVGTDAALEVSILTGRDGYLPYQEVATTKAAVAERAALRPDLVLTHRGDDAHQDHRLASELTWQLCRGTTILEYEIVKWDGDLGRPNLYVALDSELAARKVSHLMSAFPSQQQRDWYTADAFGAILRIRGIEAGAPSGTAEGFVAHKLVV